MVDYDSVQAHLKYLRLLETIKEGKEFINIYIGKDQIGDINLRMLGTTVYCNLDGAPPFTFEIPILMNDKVAVSERLTQAIDILKGKLASEGVTV